MPKCDFNKVSKQHSLLKKSPCSKFFWSAFFPHFPAFGLNTEKVILRIQSACEKMREIFGTQQLACSAKSVLRNFAKFTRKHLRQSLFFNTLRNRCFPVNFVKFLRITFFMEHLWWLLLKCFFRRRGSTLQ